LVRRNLAFAGAVGLVVSGGADVKGTPARQDHRLPQEAAMKTKPKFSVNSVTSDFVLSYVTESCVRQGRAAHPGQATPLECRPRHGLKGGDGNDLALAAVKVDKVYGGLGGRRTSADGRQRFSRRRRSDSTKLLGSNEPTCSWGGLRRRLLVCAFLRHSRLANDILKGGFGEDLPRRRRRPRQPLRQRRHRH